MLILIGNIDKELQIIVGIDYETRIIIISVVQEGRRMLEHVKQRHGRYKKDPN